jgi:alkanesulfonate monooxygenase SsuD/methylene tetrahydromethanopterin reductase-like flavin-dependent oxidoreductase (luciferase family)
VTPEVGVRLPAGVDSGELLAEAGALEAAGAHLLWAGDGELDPVTVLAAVAAMTSRIRLALELPAAGREHALETLRVLSRGRLVVGLPDGWVELAAPAGRADWREIRAQQTAAGTIGILLAHDPRLVDLLRNPDQEDDRSQDLQLAQG